MRPNPLSLSAKTSALVAALVVTAGLSALPAAHASGSGSPGAPRVTTAQTGKCVAQIRRGNKFVAVTTLTYKYKYLRKKGGGFRRVIRRVRVKVKVSCSRQCVVSVKKRGKYRPVYTVRRVKVKVKKRGKIVTVKRRKRVYKYGKCPEGVGEELGTPVSVTVLPGSFALLDFGAFQRQAPVTGKLRGFVPGKILLNSDIQMTLNRGSLNLARTAVFIDDDCNGQVSAAIRTGSPTTIGLNTARTTTATLFASGTVTSTVYTNVRLPLDLRNGDFGCNAPYLSTGYREFEKTFFLRGKVGAGGLTKLVLTSPPDDLAVEACLAPGSPTQPCNGFAIPLPILVSTKLTVSVDLSGK